MIMMKQRKVHTFNILILTIALSQPYLYGGFGYAEDASMFTHDFTINYDKFTDSNYAIIFHFDYPKYLQQLDKDLPFSTEKKR